MAKLRRALQQARTAGVEDAELLERAEAALSSTSSQEAKLKALREVGSNSELDRMFI